ncbi:MAG: Ig-like domain-containing protein [Candidatus Methanoplasma sp.]|nr:Ig-like domain-containing protein [Candidatus Methanoplasma sp.]
MPTAGALTAEGDDVLYKDKDGNIRTHAGTVEINSAYLTGVSYELDTGWYYANGSTASISKTITVTGDVHLILINMVSIPNNGLVIRQGASLTLYVQGGSMDRMTSTGSPIQLSGGSLTNAAYIQVSNANRVAVDVTGGTGNSIINYGTISGSAYAVRAAVDVTIENYGTISSSSSGGYAVYSSASVEITNKTSGFIGCTGKGGVMIYAEGGGTFTNDGTVRGTGADSDAVIAQSTMYIINKGTIEGSGNGIALNGGGNVVNSGTIQGKQYVYGIGIYINGGKVTNASQSSYIQGGYRGVAFGGDGELVNNGDISGIIGVSAENGASVILTNKRYIYGGISLPAVAHDITLEAGSGMPSSGTNAGNILIGTGASGLNFTGAPGAKLVYSTAGGSTQLGSGTVTVSIDLGGLPSDLKTGDIITLIKGDGTMTGYPANSTLKVGSYSLDILVNGRNLIAKVTGIIPDIYSIELSEYQYTFPNAVYDYPAQTPRTITVTNAGNKPTGNLTVSAAGTGSSIFSISSVNISSIAVGDCHSFTVAPQTGFPPGTYTAMITVGTASGNGNPVASQTFETSFCIEKADTVLTLVSDKDPAPYGASVTFTATVTSLNGIMPTGTVKFYNGAVEIGTAALSASGMSTFSADLPGGTHLITAEYGGDVFFNPSDDTLEQIIVPAAAQYHITATSDSGSTITPSGIIVVSKGADQTFRFSAKNGGHVSSVMVDGVTLSKSQISLGHYTFCDVMRNHSIDVKSSSSKGTVLTLTIDIAKGKGYAEYGVNGSDLIVYAGVVNIPIFADIVVTACAGEGYKFMKWETPATITTPEVAFGDVAESLYLTLYFSEEDALSAHSPDRGGLPWWVVVLMVLLALMILLFLFFYRRYYAVIKEETQSVFIIGKDRARRKSEYRFSVEGYSGAMAYRIGDEGSAQWKTILPDAGGTYRIPKGVIVGTVFIGKNG